VTLVVDASVVVAALIDIGAEGQWAEQVLTSDDLAAPHLLLAEAGNILRRLALHGEVSDDAAALAHADLIDLRVALFPYQLDGWRVWELRHNLTTYDAWYVALAEALDADLATLDARLANAPGTRCGFRLPPRESTSS
jgi:predicted nucleic acid-binding protein